MVFDGQLAALPLGSYLDHRLGSGYRALALTHTASSVPEMYPDPGQPAGFTVEDTPMAAPSEGSLEAALMAAGLASEPTYTDLRTPPSRPRVDGAENGLFDCIRTQSGELETSVADAFDAILNVPTVTTKIANRLV